ncbi:MAG TPA: hypothetical protein VNE67_00295 [Acetobacteraceae bacterium]|nr:hypothetical protein [Acetobacteraceae bacterium]
MIDTTRFRVVGLAAVLALAAMPVARGADPAASPPASPSSGPGTASHDPAAQAAGLFMQSCVRFAAQPAALRSWVASKNLARLPAPYANDFLYGLPGRVYDATTPAGKLVLVSQDGGSCSVVAENAQGKALLDRLDADLKSAGIAYKITADGPDPLEKDLRNRAYDAAAGDRKWLMLVSTVSDPAGGEAMLTTNP